MLARVEDTLADGLSVQAQMSFSGDHASPQLSRTSASGGGRGGAPCGILTHGPAAAEFNYKLATGQDPTHPVNMRARRRSNRIREATGGKLEIKLFPANQLGSDTDLLSQVRGGGVEFFNQSTSVLATFVPVAGIFNTGFAFPDYDTVWKAMDGDLGTYVRAQIAKAPIMTVSASGTTASARSPRRLRPIRTPDDLRGFKIRVPPAPMLTSLFKALDAGPTPINFNELYSALQTKVVEGQENPLAIIATTRLYEVQKYCSLTGHVWDGYWILGNRRAWERLPDDMRAIVTKEFDRSAHAAARRHREAERIAAQGAGSERSHLQRSRKRAFPRGPGQNDFLQGLEG